MKKTQKKRKGIVSAETATLIEKLRLNKYAQPNDLIFRLSVDALRMKL